MECEEWDGNLYSGNRRGNALNAGWNAKNVWNQAGDGGNQGGNLIIYVEMTFRNCVGSVPVGDNSTFDRWVDCVATCNPALGEEPD